MAVQCSSSSRFDILPSLIGGSWEFGERLAQSVREHAQLLGDEARDELQEILWADLFSEYDARYLSAYMRSLRAPLSDHFWACEERWAKDEELHYLGFRRIYGAAFGRSAESLELELAARSAQVDFEPIADLFEDEFASACLLAYDELATVRAYRANYERYALLGPELMKFIRKVTADEGRHFRNFMKLLREGHSQRLPELPTIIARIRGREGQPYGNTFVLDHDDGVWSDTLFDEAAAVLLRRLVPCQARSSKLSSQAH